MVNPHFWRNKRVFLTGHTGFKGGWLAIWLQQLGAEVVGYALPPATTPSLYEAASVGNGMHSLIGDIRDAERLKQAVSSAKPHVILHLAAQALVSEGYNDPLGTYTTNVLGTANLLESARSCSDIEAIVVVTSDKCYENKEWVWPYRETETLGGHDPYSSSKACAELVTASYRNSFLKDAGIPVATARAGNVFGGGDWSANRLIPDILQALSSQRPAQLRRPNSIRPWQHVLEPLHGYLLLAQELASNPSLAAAWNFGPPEQDCLTTAEVANRLVGLWGNHASWQATDSNFPHEAGILRLDSSLAASQLGWRSKWTVDEALQKTVLWHKAWLNSADMQAESIQQIKDYATHAHSGH